jgi:hypothetical protein
MALTIAETIKGTAVFTNEQRRTSVLGQLANYVTRPRVGAEEMTVTPVESPGKYAGPAAVIFMRFATREDADEAWADLGGVSPSWFQTGSIAEQFTSTQDPDAGVNQTVFHHRRHWPADPSDF